MDKLKTNFKYLAALISVSLADSTSAQPSVDSIEKLGTGISKAIFANIIQKAIPLEFLAHRSHSSHRSHRSHSSHRSSSGGGYRTPIYSPPAPAPAPKQTPSTSPVENPKKEETRKNIQSLASSSSSQTKPNVQKQKDDLETVIKRVQLALTFEKYYKGNIDGIMGPDTRKAITEYRKAKKLSENAYLDAELLSSLGILVP